MKNLFLIIILLITLKSYSQDTVKIPQDELENFFLAVDTLKEQDSIKSILIIDLEFQLKNYTLLSQQDSLILSFKTQEILLLHDQIKLYDDRLKVVSPPKKLSMAGHYEWCIDQADSEWLTIIGDDDGIMPGFFDYMDYLTNKWTQVEAISFKRAYFFWPGAEKIFGNIVLHYHKSKNEKLLSSKSMLLKVFSSIKEHYDLPQLYTNNMIRKSLINRIKSKSKGKFYHEMTPDVYSGVVIALSIKNYLRVDRPIFWTGSSPKSLGVAIADRESDKKENSNQNKSNEHFNLAIEDFSNCSSA